MSKVRLNAEHENQFHTDIFQRRNVLSVLPPGIFGSSNLSPLVLKYYKHHTVTIQHLS